MAVDEKERYKSWAGRSGREFIGIVCAKTMYSPQPSPPPEVALLVRGERDKLTSGKGKSGNHVIEKTEN